MKILVFRTVLIYLCVLFAMRLMGKRQLGELQPEELVSTILISNLASISIESANVPLTASLVPLFLISAIEILNSALSFKSQRFNDFLSGRPKAVIRGGEIDQDTLRELRLTVSDLLEALRGKDIFDPREVSYAVVETNGSISVAKRPENETVTRDDLTLSSVRQNAVVPFVIDGKVLTENLHWCQKDEAWLRALLSERGLELSSLLLLLGSDSDDYFLLKKEPRTNAASGKANRRADT